MSNVTNFPHTARISFVASVNVWKEIMVHIFICFKLGKIYEKNIIQILFSQWHKLLDYARIASLLTLDLTYTHLCVSLNVEGRALVPNSKQAHHCSNSMSEDCVWSHSDSFVISLATLVREHGWWYFDLLYLNSSQRLHPYTVLCRIVKSYLI